MTDPKNQKEIITENNNNDIIDSEEEEYNFDYNSSDYDSSDDDFSDEISVEYKGKIYDYEWLKKENDEIKKINSEVESELQKFERGEISDKEKVGWLKIIKEKHQEAQEKNKKLEAIKKLFLGEDSDDEEEEEQKDNQQVSKVVSKLDLIISQSQNTWTSKAEFNKYVSRVAEDGFVWKKNKLFDMKESERKELAKNFTGLDKILFDRLNGKVGKYQDTTLGLISGQVSFSLINAVPIIGNVTQLFTTNDAFSMLDQYKIALEQTFTVEEVKEIVKENQRELGKEIETTKSLIIATIQGKDDEIKNLEKQKKNIVKQGEKKFRAETADLRSKQKQEKNDLKATISQKEKALTDIEEKNKELEREKAELKESIEKLNDEKETLTSNYNKEAAIRNKLELKALETAENLKKAANNPKLISQEKKDLERLKAEHDQKAVEWTEKQKLAEKEKATLEEKATQLTNRIGEIEEQLAEMTRTAEKLEKSENRLINEYKKLEEKNILQSGIIDANAISFKERDDQKKEAQNSLISMSDKIKELEEKIRELEAERDNIQIALNSANRQLADKIREIEILNQSAEKRDKNIENLNIENLKLIDEREKAKGEIELYQNALTRQKNLYDELTNALKTEKAERKAQAEQDRLDYLALCQERDDLKNTMAPNWMRKTFHWVDWSLGTDMEKSSTIFYAKSKAWGRLSLIILVACFFLYIGSWIVRILFAIGRNIKAMFSKKQDPKEVLTEFLQTAKEAKDTLKKSPEKKVVAEAEVEVTNIEKEKVKQLPEEKKEVKASPVERQEEKKPTEISSEKASTETAKNFSAKGKKWDQKPVKKVKKRKRTKKKK